MTEVTATMTTTDANETQIEKKAQKAPKTLKPVENNKLVALKADESAKKTFRRLDKQSVEVSYSFTHSDSKQRFQVTSVLDFSACTDDDMLELASRPIIIRLQDERRKLPLNEANAVALHKRVDVKSELSRERVALDPHERSIRSLMNSLEVSYDEAAKVYAKLRK